MNLKGLVMLNSMLVFLTCSSLKESNPIYFIPDVEPKDVIVLTKNKNYFGSPISKRILCWGAGFKRGIYTPHYYPKDGDFSKITDNILEKACKEADTSKDRFISIGESLKFFNSNPFGIKLDLETIYNLGKDEINGVI